MNSTSSQAMPTTFTKSQLTEFQFRYVLNNFSKFGDEKLLSEKLSAPNSEVKWYLFIYPYGSHDNSKNFVSVYVHRESNVIKGKAAYKLGILNTKNELTNVKCFTFSGANSGFSKFVQRETLFNANKSLMCGDQLTFQCTAYYCEDKINNQHFDALLELSSHKYYKPTRLYDRLFDTDDVILEVGGVKIYVHKSVISSVSCVFKAMFQADMKESHTKEVIIKDINSKTMELMISFIYDNETELPAESIYSLLQAADKYQITDLKLACQRKLSNSINAENLIETLTVADFHNAEELKNYALHCVVNNFSFLTANNEKWYDTLGTTLLFAVAKLMNELKSNK